MGIAFIWHLHTCYLFSQNSLVALANTPHEEISSDLLYRRIIIFWLYFNFGLKGTS